MLLENHFKGKVMYISDYEFTPKKVISLARAQSNRQWSKPIFNLKFMTLLLKWWYSSLNNLYNSFLFYFFTNNLQKKASDMVKHITQETIQEIYLTAKPKSIGIADLGCSSGENTLSTITEMVETIELSSHKIAYPSPEYRLYLNDLPGNDFNAIFKVLPEFYRELKENGGAKCVYVGVYPGSFYGRVFPDKCLHFIYSSYSLHWLSKVNFNHLPFPYLPSSQ